MKAWSSFTTSDWATFTSNDWDAFLIDPDLTTAVIAAQQVWVAGTRQQQAFRAGAQQQQQAFRAGAKRQQTDA